ncbi:MAG: competence protein ComEA [Solirubrobacteraceae bacterium]|nr:competence protein ComEA [Solirubrobacteraceae bacterium]
MPELDRRRVFVIAVVALVVVVVGVRHMGGRAGAAPPPASSSATVPIEPAAGAAGAVAGGDGEVTVHVAGAVASPGVYRLRQGSRVDDAVRRAGGATRRADLSAVNLAAQLEDGRQVLVPVRVPSGGAAVAGGAATAGAAQPAKVNLNTATAEQLDTLAGVGPATAAKILAHREQHGGFGSVEELGDVPGIGERRLEALRELVTV